MNLPDLAGKDSKTSRSLSDVSNAATLTQAHEFFGQILGVVADALERLGNQQHFEHLRVRVLFGEVALKQGVTNLVDPRIGSQYLARAVDVPLGEPAVHQFEHLRQDGEHFYQLLGIRPG